MYLVFSDSHVEPGQDLSRFSWLGQRIIETKPDTIVQLGDFASMLSLSHWDKNKRLIMEGRRFNEDIAIGKKAVNLLLKPLLELQEKQRRWKEKLYSPRWIWCEGNHEVWIQQYVEQNPEMESYLLPFHEYVFPLIRETKTEPIYVPYKSFHIEDDIGFTHAPIMGNSKPIGGKYVNERALDLFHTNIIYGHTHRFLHSHRYLHGRGIKQAINAGCFFDETPTYAVGAANEHFRCCLFVCKGEDGLLHIMTESWKEECVT